MSDMKTNENFLLDGTDENKVELKRSVGFFTGTSVVVGSVVGSGIFVSPKGILLGCGSVGASLLMWVVCGIVALIGSQVYVELGCMLPKAGGDYEYILQAFGDATGFLFVWTMLLLIIPAGNAIAALTFADYALQPFFTCGAPNSARLLLASVAVFLLVYINCRSSRLVSTVQNVFTAGKVIALLFIIAMGIYAASRGWTDNFSEPFSNTQVKSLADAFYSGLFSFAGWNTLNFISEELKQPEKNLPRCIFYGLALVLVVYALVNTAYFTLLTPSEIIASNAVASSFAEKIYQPLGKLMSFCVVLSTFGYLNGMFFATSRIGFGAARRSHMPSSFSLINVSNFMPVIAVAINGSISFLFLFFGNIYRLINISSCAEYTFIFMSVLGLIVMRKTQPNLPRPVKVNICLPVFFSLVCLFIIGMTFVTIPNDGFIAILFILSGLPVYYVFVHQYNHLSSLSHFMTKVNVFLQKLTNSCFEESNK